MVVRLVAAVVARGGTLAVQGDRLCCRLPKGETLPSELTAAIKAEKDRILEVLTVARLEATVDHIRDLSEDEREAYRAALAHDLAALARAEAILAGRATEGER